MSPASGSANRTRERILSAAVEEFGARGYSGARTAAIATRAGVNPQLITYHFGGKRGLLHALQDRWVETEATLVPPDATFAQSVGAYFDATLDQPSWARLVLWQALGDDLDQQAADRSGEHPEGQRAREAVDRMRLRQRAGEVRADVDPEFVLLLAYALAFAPLALPHLVGAILGVDPLSREYRRRCLDQLLLLVGDDPAKTGVPASRSSAAAGATR